MIDIAISRINDLNMLLCETLYNFKEVYNLDLRKLYGKTFNILIEYLKSSGSNAKLHDYLIESNFNSVKYTISEVNCMMFSKDKLSEDIFYRDETAHKKINF